MDNDLNIIQKMIIADKEILTLLDLAGQSLTKKANAYIEERKKMGSTVSFDVACKIIISKAIIKRSQWNDIATSDKRLCLYPLPSRSTSNSILFNEIIEVDCHVPAMQDFKARQVIDRVVDILKNRTVNGRYLNFKGSLGELATMQGFYCCGCRFGYYNPY